jgi:hypothetical protein
VKVGIDSVQHTLQRSKLRHGETRAQRIGHGFLKRTADVVCTRLSAIEGPYGTGERTEVNFGSDGEQCSRKIVEIGLKNGPRISTGSSDCSLDLRRTERTRTEARAAQKQTAEERRFERQRRTYVAYNYKFINATNLSAALLIGTAGVCYSVRHAAAKRMI